METPDPAPAETTATDLRTAPGPGSTARRLTSSEIVQALAIRAHGGSVTEIAKHLSCSTETAYRICTQYESSTDLAAKFLAGQSLASAKQWLRAVKKGAARGRHEPARDLLLHTGAIQPVNTEASSGAKVAVFIGVSSQDPPQLLVQAQPVETPAIEAQAVVVEGEERR